MTKKCMRFFAATLLTAFLSVGCAVALELTYWCPFSGGDGEFMKQMVEDFNAAHPDVTVKMLNLKSEEYYAKFRTAAISGRGPDVAIAHTSQLAGLIKDKAIVPLDEAASAAGLDWSKFSAPSVEAAIIDGKHMAVPLDTHTLVLYYNRKLLADAGLLDASGNPKLEEGMEGFINFLSTLKQKLPDDVYPFAVDTEGAICYWLWWTYFSQQDGRLLSDDGKSADFTGAKARAALDFMVRLVEEGYWPKGVKRGGEVFKTQKTALTFNGVWAIGDFEMTPNLEFGVSPLPRIFEKDGAWGDSHTFVMVKQRKQDAEKEKAIMRFADWMTENSLTWAKAGQIPARTSVIDSPEYAALPYRAEARKLAAIAKFLPNSDKINSIRETCMMYINATIVGQQKAGDALERIEKDVNRVLAK